MRMHYLFKSIWFQYVFDLTWSDVGPFEVLNVRRVLELCLKSGVTLKAVTMAIMKVYFRWAKCDYSRIVTVESNTNQSCIRCYIYGVNPPGMSTGFNKRSARWCSENSDVTCPISANNPLTREAQGRAGKPAIVTTQSVIQLPQTDNLDLAAFHACHSKNGVY